MKISAKKALILAGLAATGFAVSTASAQSSNGISGRLLATGGVSTIEGAGGGGLSTWALITGYGTDSQIGANVHYTGAKTSDYSLQSGGVAVGLYDRVELSYANQQFDTKDVLTAISPTLRGYKL